MSPACKRQQAPRKPSVFTETFNYRTSYDHRERREVRQLLSESLLTEIEARHRAEALAKKIYVLVLAESKRVADQYLNAERFARTCVTDAAINARRDVAGEIEVLSLEAQALSGRVSATLQRGLNAATEDLATAQRKGNRVAPSRAADALADINVEGEGREEKRDSRSAVDERGAHYS